MKEVEVKILEINPAAIARKLRRFGARKVFDGILRTIYYDFPKRRLRKKGIVLRLRTKGGKAELTFKKQLSRGQAKVMREEEIYLDSTKAAEEIFEAVGLKPVYEFRKRRISYKLGDVHFELDFYRGLPPFLEIEGQSFKKVKQWVEKLGFSMSDAKNWSTNGVMRHYGKD